MAGACAQATVGVHWHLRQDASARFPGERHPCLFPRPPRARVTFSCLAKRKSPLARRERARTAQPARRAEGRMPGVKRRPPRKHALRPWTATRPASPPKFGAVHPWTARSPARHATGMSCFPGSPLGSGSACGRRDSPTGHPGPTANWRTSCAPPFGLIRRPPAVFEGPHLAHILCAGTFLRCAGIASGEAGAVDCRRATARRKRALSGPLRRGEVRTIRPDRVGARDRAHLAPAPGRARGPSPAAPHGLFGHGGPKSAVPGWPFSW